MFKGMDSDMLELIGEANESKMSAKSVGRMPAGHAKHHFENY